ncbi:MAG: hypothetical protein JSS58_04610 [Proteobacteria bacterium]|nr:hypothetical protein [Pseudomonadota bacterium]
MILFLDFDGVLHPEPCQDDAQLFCRLPLLEGLLRDFPEVDLVISSTWRDKWTLDELRSKFSADIAKRIIGATPSWKDLLELFETIGYQRHAEIEGWLRQAGRPWEQWVAIDDKPWLYKPFLPNLVLCDTAVGIDEVVLQRLGAKLNG